MRRLARRILILSAACGIALSSLGVALPALAKQALAAGCDPPAIMFGRYRWCGYFYNRFEDSGTVVRPGGVPSSVNNATDFINLVEGDYRSGDTHRITEAVFVVRTMIGAPLPSPPCSLGSCKSLTSAQLTEFEKRVRSYANTRETGSQSFGVNGHIDWFHSDYMHCGDYNSYYQPTYHDIAPYIINDSNTPECNDTGTRFDHIFIYDSSGAVIWRIRRLCMNPLGTLQPLDVAPPQYSLSARISVTSGGSPLTSGSYVQAGDPITFTYDVVNSQSDTASGIGCQAHANNKSGWQAIPAPETTGPNPTGVTCRSSFGAGTTRLGTETIASAPNDTSVCRSLIISPSTPSGGTSQVEVCVYVSSRPYSRVYGGDVSAGNPQSNACGTTTQAGIVGWSKDLTSYAGAGTKYAALAINSIYDFATNLGNTGSSATAPSGLAFANTTRSGDLYGGNFGALPCMTDYYANRNGNSFSGGGISSLTTGSYVATGPINISGNINPGNRVVLYVDGNVTITGNITFPGNWTVSNMPYFQLVVRGNIFIDRSVTNVDGIYVAQSNGANTGIIYTCSNGATPYIPSAAGSFNTPCNAKLTINGAFVAKQVQLLRTNGTVKRSTAGESNTSSDQAEVFNFSPALWMAQPPNIPSQSKYDTITSLPPIL